MTPRQKAALDFIVCYWTAHGMGPRFADISDGLKLKRKSGGQPSTSAEYLVGKLADQGLVIHVPGKARSVRPTGKCPCCGNVCQRAVHGEGEG